MPIINLDTVSFLNFIEVQNTFISCTLSQYIGKIVNKYHKPLSDFISIGLPPRLNLMLV